MPELTDRRRVVIVSPYFPPSTLAGVHRARLLARHLPDQGWEPVVLCVDERHHAEPLDPALAQLVPTATRVVKVGALPHSLARAFGIGDISLRGFWALRAALHAELRIPGASVVLITVGPFYSALLGAGVRRRFGVPVVLDYQDPWVSRWGASLPPASKGGLSHRLAKHLEPRALRGADWITAVSRGTYEEVIERHPWIDADRCTEIPIGGDSLDFEGVTSEELVPLPPRREGELRLSYVGTLLPRAGETVRALFAALARLRSAHPALGRRLHMVFVGTSNQPAGGAERAMPLAYEAGVADLVTEVPRRVPYREALAVLKSSHAILALGSDERHYTASKIYPALLAGPPVLAIFHEASTVCRVVREAGGALLVTYGDGPRANVSSRVAEIEVALSTVLERPGTVPAPRKGALDPNLAPTIAARFAEVFEQVAAGGTRGLAR